MALSENGNALFGGSTWKCKSSEKIQLCGYTTIVFQHSNYHSDIFQIVIGVISQLSLENPMVTGKAVRKDHQSGSRFCKPTYSEGPILIKILYSTLNDFYMIFI